MIIKGLDAIMARHKFDELEGYLSTSEKQLKKAETEFRSWLKEQEKTLSPEERDEFYDFHIDEHWRYEEKFPRILRNSFLVSCCSMLEHEIANICRRLKRHGQIPISLSDIRSDVGVLERAKLYFKLAGLPLSYDDQAWQELKQYYKVRNCIVHQNGMVNQLQSDRDYETFKSYLTQKGIVSDDTIEQEIALKLEFCKEVINTMWSFLEELYKVYYSQRRGIKSEEDENKLDT